jgi:hypothetical protein
VTSQVCRIEGARVVAPIVPHPAALGTWPSRVAHSAEDGLCERAQPRFIAPFMRDRCLSYCAQMRVPRPAIKVEEPLENAHVAR